MSEKKNDISELFYNGIVYGFDVGTTGIGYAVRKGDKILENGVMICSETPTTLEERRGLRRMRRTIRSRKQRLQMLRKNLIEAGLPESNSSKIETTPSVLRVKALNGDKITAEELHSAIYSLWKHRGYLTPSWARNKKNDKEAGETSKRMADIQKEIESSGCNFPCEYQAFKEGRYDPFLKKIKEPLHRDSVQGHKNIIYPRDLLVKEFETIAEKQKFNYPGLFKMKDKILYGEIGPSGEFSKEQLRTSHKTHHGVYYQRNARFDNRKPAKCTRCGINNVCRTKATEFKEMQVGIVLSNFRIIDLRTGEYKAPEGCALRDLKEKLENRKITQKTLETWAMDYGFSLSEGMKAGDFNHDNCEEILVIYEGEKKIPLEKRLTLSKWPIQNLQSLQKSG